MAKKVLVTGCHGFIGFNLCRQLIADEVAVVGVDNDYDGGDALIKMRRSQALQALDGFTPYIGSVTNHDFLQSVFVAERFDAVVHLAALAGVRASSEAPHQFFEVNVQGTVNVLDLCREHNVKKFLLASSSSVYGEKVGASCETDSIGKPLSVYAASKGAAEQVAHAYSHLYQMNVGVLRFFTVYGRWGRPDMLILPLIKRVDQGEKMPIFGSGDAVRSYIYIDDVVSGITAVLDQGVGYQVFNLAGAENVSVLEVVKLTEEVLGKKAHVVHLPADPSDTAESSGDIAFAKQTLGWTPKHTMRTGIEKTVAWYEENRDWLEPALPADSNV